MQTIEHDPRKALNVARLSLEAQDKKNGYDNWSTNRSSVSEYENVFYPVLGYYDFPKLLDGFESPVVIDFLAPTEMIRELLNKVQKPNKFGLAIARANPRTSAEIELDTRVGVFQILGDLTTQDTWDEINQTLAGRKASLIVQRGYGALDYFPADRRLYDITLRRAWQMLDPNGGVILSQLHKQEILDENGIDVEKWKEKALDQGILVETSPGSETPDNVAPTNKQPIIYIKRTPDSPLVLPRL